MINNDLKYRRPLFWDIPENKIEQTLLDADDWVVIRVFEYGTVKDFFDVIHLYGRERAIAILAQSELGPMSRAMAFLFLGADTQNRYA